MTITYGYCFYPIVVHVGDIHQVYQDRTYFIFNKFCNRRHRIITLEEEERKVDLRRSTMLCSIMYAREF